MRDIEKFDKIHVIATEMAKRLNEKELIEHAVDLIASELEAEELSDVAIEELTEEYVEVHDEHEDMYQHNGFASEADFHAYLGTQKELESLSL